MFDVIPVEAALAAIFTAVVLAALAVQSYVVERRAFYKTLRSVRSFEVEPADLRQRELAIPVVRRVVLPGLRRIGHAIRRFTPASVLQRLDQELVYAGSPPGWDGERLLAVKVVIAFVLAASVVAAVPVLGLPVLRAMILVPAAALVGYYLPEWVVRSRSAARQKQIRRALPDALDLLSITVEAGLGFDAAMERVARQMEGPLGEELFRVVQEMRLGKSRIDALRDLADRSSVPELRSFVLAMVQADIFGIAIGEVLKIQADEIRIKRRQHAEEQAQKIPVKIVFPLVLCIFPSLFIVLLGPAAITIYQQLIAP